MEGKQKSPKKKWTKENGKREAPEKQLWEVNQGGAKGNKQKAKYQNLEGMNEKSVRRERGKRKNRKRKTKHWTSH